MAGKYKLKDSGIVSVYNSQGDCPKVKIVISAGVDISWKRNGSRGSVKAVIIGWADAKPGWVLIKNYDRGGNIIDRTVWIKQNSLLMRITDFKSYELVPAQPMEVIGSGEIKGDNLPDFFQLMLGE